MGKVLVSWIRYSKFMRSTIERVVNNDKNDYINKRHLLVCDNRYWLSHLQDLEYYIIEYFDNCPKCWEDLKLMYISQKSL